MTLLAKSAKLGFRVFFDSVSPVITIDTARIILRKIARMKIDERDVISASEFARCPGKLFREASEGRQFVIFTNNAPTAAVVSMDEYRELNEIREREEDLRLLSLAITRVAADSGRRHDLDDVIAELGFTDEEIDEAED
jgi:prevent-host-death family protein